MTAASPAWTLGSRAARLLRALFRSRAFETATTEGRAFERERRAIQAALASGCAKALNALLTLALLRLALTHFGPDRFALWATANSVLLVLPNLDLGIGSGLVNQVASANGRDDRDHAAAAVSSALALLAGSCLSLLLILACVYPFVPWPRLLDVGVLARDETGPTLAVAAIFVAMSMPLGIAQRVQIGYQESSSSSGWTALGNALGFGAFVLALHMRAGVPATLGAFLGGQALAAVAQTCWLFGRSHRWLVPRWALVHVPVMRSLAQQGARFVVGQLGSLVLAAAPPPLMGHLYGSSAVASYTLAVRPIWAFVLLSSFWVIPLWPAYAEAHARGDRRWVARTYRRSLALATAIASTGCLAFALWHGVVFRVLGGAAFSPSRTAIAGFCTLIVAHSTRWVALICLNGCGRVGRPASYQALGAALTVAAALAFGGLVSFEGSLWIFVAGESLVTAALLLDVSRMLRKGGSAHADDDR